MRVQRAIRAASWVVGLSATVVVFAAISPWGQAARHRMARGECPFPHGGGGSLSRLTSGASWAAQGAVGTAAANSRSIWGLTLEDAKSSDVQEWAHQRKLLCRATRASANTLECQIDIPKLLGDSWQHADQLTVVFHFNGRGTLQAVRAMGAFGDDAQATAALRALVSETQHQVGGEPTAHEPISFDTLAQGPLSQVRVAFPRSDLYADLSATKMHQLVSVQQYVQAP